MKISLRTTWLSLCAVGACSILSASVLTSVQAAERTLAGIKTFSPIGIVLSKYGDPTFIMPGTQVASVTYGYEGPVVSDSTATSTSTPVNSDTTSAGATATIDAFDPTYESGSRYYYDFPKKGVVYEFVSTSAGRVVEIKIYGYHSQFKTSLGIGLGSNYEDIVMKYGYPEQTFNSVETDGDHLTLIYTERDHVAFRLVRGKVAVISVVAPD